MGCVIVCGDTDVVCKQMLPDARKIMCQSGGEGERGTTTLRATSSHMARKSPRSSHRKVLFMQGSRDEPHLDQPPGRCRTGEINAENNVMQLTASRWRSSLLSHAIFFHFLAVVSIASCTAEVCPCLLLRIANHRRVSECFSFAVQRWTPAISTSLLIYTQNQDLSYIHSHGLR